MCMGDCLLMNVTLINAVSDPSVPEIIFVHTHNHCISAMMRESLVEFFAAAKPDKIFYTC